jgi:hypothetical protein
LGASITANFGDDPFAYEDWDDEKNTSGPLPKSEDKLGDKVQDDSDSSDSD